VFYGRRRERSGAPPGRSHTPCDFGCAALVPCARNPANISAAQAAPRCVLLGRHTTRYPSLVGLAMHPPGRRTYAPDSRRRALAMRATPADRPGDQQQDEKQTERDNSEERGRNR
jgi:hypothetical protein